VYSPTSSIAAGLEIFLEHRLRRRTRLLFIILVEDFLVKAEEQFVIAILNGAIRPFPVNVLFTSLVFSSPMGLERRGDLVFTPSDPLKYTSQKIH
jgi:hypothetical protein